MIMALPSGRVAGLMFTNPFPNSSMEFGLIGMALILMGFLALLSKSSRKIPNTEFEGEKVR
jgi:hypothetical protein